MNNLEQFSPQLITLFKEEAHELLSQWEDACIELGKSMKPAAWDQLFAAIHSLKGSVQTVGIKAFGDYLQSIESYLSEHSVDTPLQGALQLLLQSQTQCVEWINHIESLDESVISIEIAKLKNLLVVQADENTSSLTENPISQRIDEQLQKKLFHGNSNSAKPSQISDDVKIPGKLLDKILDQLSDLQTHQKILGSYLSLDTVDKNLAIQSLTISQTRVRELTRIASEFRSVNAEVIFKRLERSVTETNLALAKDVQIEFEGHLVKLDKSIADQIVSPLIHIVRNSVDHGIESEKIRLDHGKSPAGRVTVKVNRRVKNIEFIVEDDGGGIDVQKLYKKAIENNVLNAVPENTNNDLILQLLCSSGLSTASEVTDISGRGVGMNAVYEKVLSLGGNMKLEFEKGQGSRFILSLPNNFNAIKAIVVKISEFKMAIPMNEVIEVYRFGKTNLTSSLGKQKLPYKDDIINFIHLGTYLRTTCSAQPDNDIVIGLISGKRPDIAVYGVDAIIGQQEIAIRRLEEKLTGLPGCQGAAYFNDGSSGLVLSLNELQKKTHYPEVAG